MSSLHIDELYFGTGGSQIEIPDDFQVINPSRAYGVGVGVGVRSYATVTQALNEAYRNGRTGGGTGVGGCGSCSNCSSLCRSRGGSGTTGCTNGGCTCHCSGGNCQNKCKSLGYTYVRTAGSNCICDTGAAQQKCNLTAALCKANNPRATSCAVRTYTNGSCVCDCKTGTGQNLTPPAAPGTVKSVSKPVTSTTIKPGVVPATGKFGSYDIATLKAQPAGTYVAEVTKAAAARQYADLRQLQTTEGQSLHAQLNSVNAKAKRIQELMRANNGQVTREAQTLYNELKEDAKRTLELHRKWKATFNGAAYAKSPDGFKINPVKNKDAKEIEEAIEKGAGTAYGLSSVAQKSPLGPLAGPIVDTIGDIATGAITGNPPDPAGLAGNFTEGLKTAITTPPLPPTMEIITNMINDSGVQQMLLGRTSQGTIPV